MDPTLSMTFNSKDWQINILGLTGIRFPIFEIDLFFERSMLRIANAGQDISFVNTVKNPGNYTGLLFNSNGFKNEGCLLNYMKPVIAEARYLLEHQDGEDNFISSLELNRKMLELIN